MSSAAKKIKKGYKSAASKVKGALKGDIKDIVSLGSLGMSDLAVRPIEVAGREIQKGIEGVIPEMPEPVVHGAAPGTVQQAAPNVDVAATEGSRRKTGSAKGSRKLRVPLGGLR